MGHRIRHAARWAADGKWHTYARAEGGVEALITGNSRADVIDAAVHFIGADVINADLLTALDEATEARRA